VTFSVVAELEALRRGKRRTRWAIKDKDGSPEFTVLARDGGARARASS
jgi:hypothetical protein